jgi:hypothetical protein
MSNDRKHGPDEAPANQPQETADEQQRDIIGRFAKYTAPALLALLWSDRGARAS